MEVHVTPTFILIFFFLVSSRSRVSLARDVWAVFLRLGNFVGIVSGMSSSDVGCVEDDPELGVFRRCKAEAGVAEEDSFEGESESES